MHVCISEFIAHVRTSIYVPVCELIVQWVAINGLSQSILQENVWEQKALSHLSHTFVIPQSMSKNSEGALLHLKDKQRISLMKEKGKKNIWLLGATQIHCNHFASRMYVLLHKQASLGISLFSACQMVT